MDSCHAGALLCYQVCLSDLHLLQQVGKGSETIFWPSDAKNIKAMIIHLQPWLKSQMYPSYGRGQHQLADIQFLMKVISVW